MCLPCRLKEIVVNTPECAEYKLSPTCIYPGFRLDFRRGAGWSEYHDVNEFKVCPDAVSCTYTITKNALSNNTKSNQVTRLMYATRNSISTVQQSFKNTAQLLMNSRDIMT